MNPWLVLLIIVIVIFIVWWALWRNSKTKPDFEVHGHEEGHAHEAEAVHAAVAEAPAEAPPAAETAQAAEVSATASVQPQDLTIIEGIGPKVNQLLQAAGIQTFAQLAETSEASLREMLEAAKLQFIDPSTWAEQARLIKDDKMDDSRI